MEIFKILVLNIWTKNRCFITSVLKTVSVSEDFLNIINTKLDLYVLQNVHGMKKGLVKEIVMKNLSYKSS